jgi:outer membrane protein
MTRSTLIVLIIALVSLAFSTFVFFQKPRIAYIRSHDLVNRFEGSLQARKEFEDKKSSMMANVDSLKLLLDRTKIQFNADAASMTPANRRTEIDRITLQENQFQQYRQAVEDKIAEEDSRRMSAVLTQINSFVQQYAEANRLDVVLGTTLSGSLLYGKNSMDITEQVLEDLNKNYREGK